MRTRIVLVAFAAGLLLLASALAGVLTTSAARDHTSASEQRDGKERSYDVGLWGDLPYTPEEVTAGVPNLISDMNSSGLAFTVFDGDIKNGSSRCDDAVYGTAAARFDTVKQPTVYVPGDNEWTDCHRVNNGSFDPLDRLALVRSTLAASAFSFGQKTMRLERQLPSYPENVRWVYGGVVWVGLNVVGSNNNHFGPSGVALSEEPRSHRTDADRQAAENEYLARDAANRAWLADSFALAKRTGAAGVAVVIQADPGFEITGAARAVPGVNGLDGLDPFIDELRNRTVAFGHPVLLVHGDSHYFRIDKPLLTTAATPARILQFTRLETFGEFDPHWVRLTVNPSDPDVFSAKAEIVDTNVTP